MIYSQSVVEFRAKYPKGHKQESIGGPKAVSILLAFTHSIK